MRFHLEQLSACCVKEQTQQSPTLFAGQFATFLCSFSCGIIAVLCFYFRNSSKDMITTHKEPVMCVKYNKSFKHVVTASESSVI